MRIQSQRQKTLLCGFAGCMVVGMNNKILGKNEVRGITEGVMLAHEMTALARLAAGKAIIAGANKEQFMNVCSECWETIAKCVQEHIDEASKRVSQP